MRRQSPHNPCAPHPSPVYITMQVAFLNEEVDKYIKFLQVGNHLLWTYMLAVDICACCTRS